MHTWFGIFLLLLGAAGCAKHAAEQPYYYDSYDDGGYGGGGGGYGGMDYAEADSAPMAAAESVSRSSKGRPSKSSGSASMGPPPAPPPPQAMPMEEAWEEGPMGEPEPEEQAQAPVRMVHYDGHARIRVTKPSDLLADVEKAALDAGGRVDQLYGNTITIRVPVEKFDDVWDQLLDMGDVLDRSVRADDITDQFTAVDLRVKTLKTTRERLIELLAKATEEEEKLILLQQITRVTEQLEQFESQLRVLGDLAAMSRITIEAIPRQAFTGTQKPALDGMWWISQISPFRRAVFDDEKRLALAEQDGLVTLSKTGPWVAESADGAVVWNLRLPNDPVGDGQFWVDALVDRLAEPFAKAETRAVGAWQCVAFEEAGADAPYTWQVCAQPMGRHLWISQTFFPSPATVERYGEKVDAALKSVGGGV